MRRVLIAFILLCLIPSDPVQAQNTGELKRKAIEHVESIRPLITEMATSLWDFSEIALQERRSAELLIGKLRAAGFKVETGAAGMPTAFVATYGSGSPVIGIIAEFDALPGVGNAPEPKRQPREDGISSGHGCGHNLFGAASVGGAIALKTVMEQAGLKGTIKVFGSPAEETLVGKVYMAKAGVFDGLDAAIDWHPELKTEVSNAPNRAMNNFEVEFFGQAAHASFDPWNGRSALDAVEVMNHAVNLMREHIKPTARVHYVIPRAGEAPNVVPEYAKVWYYVRDINREEVDKHYDRILKIVEGAALATGATYKVQLITAVHEYLFNRPLQEVMQANLELVGPPKFTAEEQVFGRNLQKFLGKEEKGIHSKIEPLADRLKPLEGGSTDVAEVSWITPTAAFVVATAPEGVPWHSWATTASHGTSIGHKGAMVAAKVIAATGIDLLTRPDLVQKARAFFQQATGGKPYQSPIPKDQPPPVGAKND
ncbi:MAG TPA: amidohydrolase [Blastocatellia bacterium]